MKPEDQNTLGRPNESDLSWSTDAPTFAGNTPPPVLDRGTRLSNGRYEILALLGQGAMGAVYKAKDTELDRWVAIKVIQPMLVSSPAILRRFKQELILARQITHKNVIRIFDIGETDGMKFITMEYVDGGDLKSVIVEQGKIPPEEAMNIVRQICHALQAAHAEGVVHRDLKPQNIMMDQNGRVVVMDFGIAHSQESPSMTMTGALMGTPEYMSPEQAKGEKTDARADIFAVGIILYEMLTGRIPFKSNTVVETMYKRTQEPAIPPVDLDSSLPIHANKIVMKCLERDPANRYQTVEELLRDVEAVDLEKKIGTLDRVRRKAAKQSISWKSIAIVAMLGLLIALALFFVRNRFKPNTETAAHAPITILISDFTNHTGNAVFEGTLEPVVKIALEGAGFITAYDRSQLRTLGIEPVSGRFDEQVARKAAVSQGLGVVISGSLETQGTGYLLSVKATQAVTGNTIRSAEESASNKDQVVFAATKLAGAVRKALGDDTSDSAQRFALETLSATSLEAIHEYSVGVDAMSNGKHEDALRSFSKALDIDQNFGLAYTAMAIAARNQGQQQEAEKYVKLAVNNIDHMTERERYRTQGMYYLLLNDAQKCVDEYSTMVSRFPADVAAHNNRALCWAQLRNMTKALEDVRQAAAILPKRPIYRFSISVYASYSSEFQTGEREARTLLDMDPNYPDAFTALAWAQLGQGQVEQATDSYRKLAKVGKLGASDAASGLADLALYEGRFAEAVRILEKGAADDLAAKYPDRAAAKLATLAYTRLLQDQKDLAVRAAENALANSKIVRIRFLAGRIFAAAGQVSRAQTESSSLTAQFQAEPQAYGKIIEGEIALAARDANKAIKSFNEANSLVDTWIGRFDLGRAYLEANAFQDAVFEFDRCFKRRGEVLSLFNEEATYGYLPPLYYYLGRVREGLKSPNFAEYYGTYLTIREKAGEDPLLADVRKRAAQ
jgi:serine/threonine protein kinase/tetratricopeptide (TPR) repeat protein